MNGDILCTSGGSQLRLIRRKRL